MTSEKTDRKKREERHRIPAADIFETSDGVCIQADMPGVDKDSVDITVERSVLTIAGKVETESFEDHEPVYSEFATRGYKRSFTLSDEFDLDKVRAEFDNGVLRISVPKSESAKPRKIEIRS